MLFNLLALALPFGQSTFSSLEDHRPLASMAVCVFGLHSLGPYTFLAHSGLGWSPLRVLQWFLSTGIYTFLLGTRDADSGEKGS